MVLSVLHARARRQGEEARPGRGRLGREALKAAEEKKKAAAAKKAAGCSGGDGAGDAGAIKL